MAQNSEKDNKKSDSTNPSLDQIKSEFYQRVDVLLHKEESRLISCMWKNPELFLETDLTKDDFSHNEWRTVFVIGKDLVKKDGAKVLQDAQAVDSYLSKHKKLAEVWNSIDGDGSFLRVTEVTSHMNAENYEVYLTNFKKLKIILKLVEEKILIIDEKTLSNLMDLTIDELYDNYEKKINEIFSTSITEEKVYDIYTGIEDNIERWNEGEAMGMLMDGLEQFSQSIGGIPMGGVSLVGGISNSGKSSLVRNTVFPIAVPSQEQWDEYNEFLEEEKRKQEDFEKQGIEYEIEKPDFANKTVIFMNEEGIDKWQRELLVWVVNNKLLKGENNPKVYKGTLVQGNFKNKKFSEKKDDNYNKWLLEGVKWMRQYIPPQHIIFAPLKKFSTKNTIKKIKKYASMGYENFIIDTFKIDNTDDAKIDNNTRLQLVQNMTHLYNVAKPDGGKNVRIICTVQLSKAYTLQRYLSQECLAESKNIIDVCALGVFIRKVWQDELAGGTKELRYKKYNDNTNTEYTLSPNFNYILLFPVKTREGTCDQQCVAQVNWATNEIKELGYVELSPSI